MISGLSSLQYHWARLKARLVLITRFIGENVFGQKCVSRNLIGRYKIIRNLIDFWEHRAENPCFNIPKERYSNPVNNAISLGKVVNRSPPAQVLNETKEVKMKLIHFSSKSTRWQDKIYYST